MGIVACCCMCIVPKSTDDRIIAEPEGQIFSCGMANQYDEHVYKKHESLFNGRVSKNDVTHTVEAINELGYSYLPCPTMWCCGYFLAIPTLGLSLLCLYFSCVKEAEEKMAVKIDNFNRKN